MDPQAILRLNLQDIHLPPGVSWWPPAPGWWLLALLACLALGYLGYQLSKVTHRLWQRRQLLRTLNRLSEQYQQQALLQATSKYLRAVAIRYYGRERVARLQGNAWLVFLQQTSDCEDFTQAAGQQFLTQTYCNAKQVDTRSALALARLWLKQHPKAERRGAKPC